MSEATPTIKGMFVMSHIDAYERENGMGALAELEHVYGKPIKFGMLEDVPAREENAILEHIVALDEPNLSSDTKARRAGELHFENFVTTMLGEVLFPLFGRNLKFLFMQSGTITGRIFSGMPFSPKDLGERAVAITISNLQYPPEHFVGFFSAWIATVGSKPDVTFRELAPQTVEYTIHWSDRTP